MNTSEHASPHLVLLVKLVSSSMKSNNLSNYTSEAQIRLSSSKSTAFPSSPMQAILSSVHCNWWEHFVLWLALMWWATFGGWYILSLLIQFFSMYLYPLYICYFSVVVCQFDFHLRPLQMLYRCTGWLEDTMNCYLFLLFDLQPFVMLLFLFVTFSKWPSG